MGSNLISRALFIESATNPTPSKTKVKILELQMLFRFSFDRSINEVLFFSTLVWILLDPYKVKYYLGE